MTYSAWQSPGFGVCGQKNSYSSKVKIGNYVEDLEHFLTVKELPHRNFETEANSKYTPPPEKESETKDIERLEMLEREFGNEMKSSTYKELLNIVEEDGGKPIYSTYSAEFCSNQVFPKKNKDEDERLERNLMKPRVKIFNKTKAETELECKRHVLDRNFSLGFSHGLHVRRS